MKNKTLSTLPGFDDVSQRYAVAVTDDVMALADAPAIALQYLPDARELMTTPDELPDPIGDAAHSPMRGIVHRYPDRVLLKPVHVCAVYCRFCFRREMVGPGREEALSEKDLAQALAYIRNTPSIWEVIVTGGDPFVLSPRRLQKLMQALNEIDHIKVIRFHTRVPVADPGRVTPEMAAALASSKAVYVALHVNHAAELTEKVRTACSLLQSVGVILVSQSVLLRGVNDSAETLEKLFRALAEMKVIPYYLHHPDKAPGTSHFRLPLREGLEIYKSLRGRLSGLAIPSYMLDIPGGFGKVCADSGAVVETPEGYRVTDVNGVTHDYRD